MFILFVAVSAFAGEGLDLTGTIGPSDDATAVSARFLTDASRVAPGGSFRVGALLTMEKAWHVYWRNPGDAGLATELSVSLPEGWSASSMHWPVPVRFDQSGGIAGFGYEKRVLLWRTVRVSPNAPIGQDVKIRLKVDWLACRVKCVPGRASGAVTVRVAARPSASTDRKTFDGWASKLPLNPSEPNAPISLAVATTPTGGAPRRSTVVLRWNDANAPRKLEWFPPADRAVTWGEPRFARSGKTVKLTLTANRLKGQSPSADVLVGLVAWRDTDGARRAVRIPLRTTPQKPSADKPTTETPSSPQSKGSSP